MATVMSFPHAPHSVHQKHEPINEYSLYHAVLLSTADDLKRSLVVSETEIHLKDNAAATPRTPSPSEEDAFSQKWREGVVSGAEAEVNFSHYAEKKRSTRTCATSTSGQKQDRDQDHLTLLTSLSEQTTSLLQTYSQFQSKSKDKGDTNVLERVTVLGQIALVSASSLIVVSATSGNDRVVCRLDVHSKARVEIKVEVQTQVQREVVVALAHIRVALVKQFDRTGDRRDLEEAKRGGFMPGMEVIGGRGK